MPGGIRRTVRPAGAVSASADGGRAPNGATVNPNASAKAWTPTVANLMVLLVCEMVAFGVIRYMFRRIAD